MTAYKMMLTSDLALLHFQGNLCHNGSFKNMKKQVNAEFDIKKNYLLTFSGSKLSIISFLKSIHKSKSSGLFIETCSLELESQS